MFDIMCIIFNERTVYQMEEKKIETTLELVDIIRNSMPVKATMGSHPARRTFQAIRIEVNHELDVIEPAIEQALELLNVGGRVAVITFHSLEDRAVKNAFNDSIGKCICPPDLPYCGCGAKSKGKIVTRKPILPSDKEIEENSRSKSAKLRVFERI